MKAILHVEKSVVRGEKKIRITKFENFLSDKETPMKYLKGFDKWPETDGPAMGMTDKNTLDIYIPKNASTKILEKFEVELKENPKNPGIKQISIAIRQEITEDELTELLTWMKHAGARLTKINKKLAEENRGWEGPETFEI